MGEESGGEEDANEAESPCFRFFQSTCWGRSGRAPMRTLAAAFPLSQSAGPLEGISGAGAVRSADAFDLSWTTPSTKKVSFSKKNTPGVNGSMKSAAR